MICCAAWNSMAHAHAHARDVLAFFPFRFRTTAFLINSYSYRAHMIKYHLTKNGMICTGSGSECAKTRRQ